MYNFFWAFLTYLSHLKIWKLLAHFFLLFNTFSIFFGIFLVCFFSILEPDYSSRSWGIAIVSDAWGQHRCWSHCCRADESPDSAVPPRGHNTGDSIRPAPVWPWYVSRHVDRGARILIVGWYFYCRFYCCLKCAKNFADRSLRWVPHLHRHHCHHPHRMVLLMVLMMLLPLFPWPPTPTLTLMLLWLLSIPCPSRCRHPLRRHSCETNTRSCCHPNCHSRNSQSANAKKNNIFGELWK